MIRRLRALLAARSEQDPEAGLALIFVVAFMLIIATLSLAALTQLVSEVRQTQFSRKHAQTVNTALAGLSAGVNRIRAAVDTNTGAGVVANLPCPAGAAKGTLTGTIDAAGQLTYATDIYYLSTDPSAMTPTQVAAAAMTCPLSAVPKFAYLVAAGSQAALPGADSSVGNRTVHAVYDFTTSNASRYGGSITTTNGLCWDAGSSPSVGSPITLQNCLAIGAPSQQWYFRPDLSIQWTGSAAANLCLDYRGVAVLPRDSLMTLQTCYGSGAAGTAYDSLNQVYVPAGRRYQEFTLGTWLKDVTANGDAGSANCIVSYTPGTGLIEQRLIGDRLAMSPVCTTQSFAVLSNSTGAGGAGGVTNGLPSISEQLVNYQYQQDCLDVNSSNPANGLIHYPCHQAPDASKVEGNQRFQYGGSTTSPGTLKTTRTDDPRYNYPTVCFDSNGSAVTLVTCVGGKTSQQWQLTGFSNGDYPGSYLIKDWTGRCITATSGYSTQLHTCDGSDAQKWNAPPGGTQSLLDDIAEQ